MSLESLLSYQVGHVLQLQEAFTNNQCILDASETGTGKTYCAIVLAKLMKLEPLIICPKSVVTNWINVSKELKVDVFGIANYEMIKGGKYYTSKLEIVQCPYVDIIEAKEQNKKTKKEKNITDFVFQFPNNMMIIFDEAHRCKNHKTITSRMLISIAESGNKVLLLSATIIDKIECFKPFGTIFKFYADNKKYTSWIKDKVKSIKNDLDTNGKKLKIIHDSVFPSRGSRLRIAELGDLFPQNQVIAKCYHSDDTDQIKELYDTINHLLKELKDKEARTSRLGKIMIARQKIEMFKVPIMLDLAQEAIDSNYSVVIFVNFRQTMNQLMINLDTKCVIHGEQTLKERQECIDDFQSNKSRIMIAIIQAGGVGISLHDIHGGHPRMSIISPTWCGQDLVQCLGRIHRAKAKTPALQRIVFCANTCEEDICELIQEKMTNIKGINDGDLVPVKIEKLDLEVIEENLDDFNKMKKDNKEDAKDKQKLIKPKTIHILKEK